MPVSAAQHRATAGTHQNKIFENNRRSNITHTSVINGNSQHVQRDQYEFPLALTHVGNSPDTMSRPTEQLTLRLSMALLFCLPLLRQDNSLYAASGNAALDSGRDVLPPFSRNAPHSDKSGNGFSTMLSPVTNALYETGQYIARHDPLRFPVADASPVQLAETSTTVASAARHLKGDSYIITDEQKKNELISSLVQYLVSDGQMTADEGKNVELRLRSEAAGMPMVAARLDNEEVDTSRKKRALVAENDPRTAEHIKEHCAFEEEVLDAQGENQGKVLIFQAQRAENPFRVIYDNNPDGRPSPEVRGVADALNVSADILTLGIKPLIGKLIANAKRREYYQNQGDEICAERFRRLFIAEAATSLDVDGLTFTRRGRAGKVRPSELLHALPEQERAAFFTRNPHTGIRTEILLELKQGNGAINDNGRKVYLKPTERKNEFVTYHPDAVKPEMLERRVIVDENNLSWRYADSFDSSELNVEISEGKRQVRLHGENFELHQNGAGKYEVVVNKASGIKEFVPVYMEPLSRTWHLSVHNEHPAFSNKQADIIREIKGKKEDGFHYIPRGNNNQNYYGNGNIYVQEKMGDSSHYPWGRYIEMNGELVPVRNTKHQGQGVLFEVYDKKFPEKAGHPIEWDGNRWLFERKTSVHVSKDLENLISPEMVYEKVDAGKLSAPDHQGLRYDANGDRYLKINGREIRIKQRDQIYFIENKNGDILYFNYKRGTFLPAKMKDLDSSSFLCTGRVKRGLDSPCSYTMYVEENSGGMLRIRTEGNSDAQLLLYPEYYNINLKSLDVDATQYETAISRLTDNERQAMREWTHIEGTRGKYSNGERLVSKEVNFELNQRLIKGKSLTNEQKAVYDGLISAMTPGKIPEYNGEFLRGAWYESMKGIRSPWAEGKIKVNDIVTNGRPFMSVTDSEKFIREMVSTSDINGIDSFVTYKIENGQPTPFLADSVSIIRDESEWLFKPNTYFRVKGISSSTPQTTRAEVFSRDGVILEQIEKKNVPEGSVVKNLYTGDIENL